jgi:Uma2 family endonuclease
MTQAKLRFQTFEEYFEWSNDHADNVRYELMDGDLIELPPESEPNDAIANYLFLKLVELGVPFRFVRPGKCEIQVAVLQQKDAANRYPDLVVLGEEHLPFLQKRLTIKLNMPVPRLVAEVISPGKKNRARDYERKRAQYADRGIPEYWLIDPQNQTVTVLVLETGDYVERGIFRGNDPIISPTFPTLQLTPGEIFAAAT